MNKATECAHELVGPMFLGVKWGTPPVSDSQEFLSSDFNSFLYFRLGYHNVVKFSCQITTLKGESMWYHMNGILCVIVFLYLPTIRFRRNLSIPIYSTPYLQVFKNCQIQRVVSCSYTSFSLHRTIGEGILFTAVLWHRALKTW